MKKHNLSEKTIGFILAFIGIVAFSFTLPMSKIALGTLENPQIPFTFITFGRAVVAGLASILVLLYIKPKIPARRDFIIMAIGGFGIVFGFPFFSNYALKNVSGVHGSVITGVLPLATAMLAAIYHRKWGNLPFWGLVLAGFALVLLYAYLQSGHIRLDDKALLLAVFMASFGYVLGSSVSMRIPAEQVICWTLIIYLPFNIILSYLYFPTNFDQIGIHAWGGFFYLGLFSMWLGFFFWYRGLAMGGVMIVSQFQLLQPFLSVLFSVWILGEPLDQYSLWFMFFIIAIIYGTKKIKI